MASENGSTSFGIELLHALVIGGFACGGRLFIGLDLRDIRRVVDVPRLDDVSYSTETK